MKKVLIGWLVVMATVALAADLRTVPLEMQGRYDATHLVEVNAGPLFDGYTNGQVYTATYAVPSNSIVEFVAYELGTPFVGAPATNQVIGDATLAFGTENSSTAFLTARQVGTNTSVWWVDGVPTVTPTVAYLKTTNTLTYMNADTNTMTTTTVAYVTSVSVTAAATRGTTYAAGTNLMVTLAPASGQNLDWATAGKARVFLKVRMPYGK